MLTSKKLRFFVLAALLTITASAASLAPPANAFLKLIDRPRVPLAAEVSPMAGPDGMDQFHFTYASEAGERVTGIIIKNKGATGRLPVVVGLHGTGLAKESMVSWMKELAPKGFLTVAIDGRYHGERAKTGRGAYDDAILRTYRGAKEHPLLYDSAWDIMRLVDYLETRDDVDAKRIGMVGISKGGMELYLAAAADTRIAVSVPCISVQSFNWALDHDAWQSRVGTFQPAIDAAAKEAGVEKIDPAFVRKFYDKVAPGIYGQFDGPSMAPLIAPRPMLTINGGADARTPIPGLEECFTAIKKAYAAAGASDKFASVIEPNTGHAVTPEARKAAIEFLVKWLKP